MLGKAEDSARHHFGAIQSLRAIAAALVVFQHVTYYVVTSMGVDFSPYLEIDYGRLGVSLFFVISGFVMIGCLNQGNKFLLNRALRIYPAFWAAIGLSGLLLLNSTLDWRFDWKSTTLIPTTDGNGSYRIPYWTLMFEVAFYGVIYLWIVAGGKRNSIKYLCVGWLAVIVAVNKYVAVPIMLPGALVLFSYYNIYFIFGMLIGLYHEDLIKVPSVALALVGVGGWAVGENNSLLAPIAGNVIMAVSFASTVCLSLRVLKIKWLEALGNLSYGVYLLHVPVALATIDFLRDHLPTLRLSLLWLVTILVALVVSGVFGLGEHWFHARVVKRRRRRRSVAVA